MAGAGNFGRIGNFLKPDCGFTLIRDIGSPLKGSIQRLIGLDFDFVFITLAAMKRKD